MATKGIKHTEEHKEKIRQSLMGHFMSKETRDKIGNARREMKLPEEWRKKIGLAKNFLGHKHSDQTKIKISLSRKGKETWNKGKTDIYSEETLQKIRKGRAKQKFSLETRKKLSEAHKGEKSHLWKGGITPINRALRNTLEYRKWKKDVLERDNYTCQGCGVKGGNLHVDHIKQFAYFPELRTELSNGRTLCIDCHKKTDTYKRKLLTKTT